MATRQSNHFVSSVAIGLASSTDAVCIMDNVNTEDFISEIQKQIAIWDTSAEEYSDKTKKQNAWEDVIRKFCSNFEEKTPAEKQTIASAYQKKWKSLRTCYTRELAKLRNMKPGSAALQRKKYVYFDLMSFLQTASKPTASTLGEDLDSPSDGSGREDEFQDNTRLEESRTSPKRKKRGSNSNKDEALLRVLKDKYSTKRAGDDMDEDQLFLLSLVPYFKKLPEEVRLDLKGEIFTMLRRAIRFHQQQQMPDTESPHTSHMRNQNYYKLNSNKTDYPHLHMPYQPALQHYPLSLTYPYHYPNYAPSSVHIHVPVPMQQTPFQHHPQTPNQTMTPTGTGQKQESGASGMNGKPLTDTQSTSFTDTEDPDLHFLK